MGKAASLVQWSEYIPHDPTSRQLAGLLSSRREVFYGGAAGGGKSDWLLMAALQYVDVPNYAALLLRRTFPQLNAPGGLIPRSHEWLGGTGATWSELKSRWTFPSGAVLQFGHLQREKDKFAYQGPEFQFVGWDELTHFSESQYRYLFSRLRRLEGSDVPIRMRSASNPGGEGHDWVKRRFVTDGRDAGRVFIPAKLVDNPHLDQAEYRASLAELDPVTRKQLLAGDWDVRPAGAIFKREHFEIVAEAPANARSLRGWDFAATLPKPGTDPDYTVGGRVSRTPESEYFIEHVDRYRLSPGDTQSRFVQRVNLDGRNVAQRLEQEPGSSGKMASAALIKATAGFDVRAAPSTGSKGVRAAPLAAQAEAGNVKLVDGPWISDFLDELEAFGPECPHDDQVDAVSLAFNSLHHQQATWGDFYGEAAA